MGVASLLSSYWSAYCTRRFPCVDNAVVAICNPVSINQETANATGAHLSEGDFLAGEGGHASLKRGRA
jgi:hypothetical protein